MLLAAAYLVQCYSPLRLNLDVIHFVTVAASAADGEGFLFKDTPTYYPIGYAALLSGLERIGLGISWAFVALNCLFIAVGVGASYALYRMHFGYARNAALGLCCLVLLSYVLVKHVTLPMSDVPFLGASLAAVAVIAWAEQYQDRRRWTLLALGAVLAGGAILIRTAGITLLPALAWACFTNGSPLQNGFRRLIRHRRGRLLTAGAALAAVAALFVVLRRFQEKYVREVFGFYDGLSWQEGLETIVERLVTWGELFANVPESKLPAFLGALLPFVGFAGLLVLGAGIWARRRRLRSVEIYFLAYAALMLIWPAFTARFWLAVIPLAMGWVGLAFQRFAGARGAAARFAAPVLALYLAAFMLLGAAALAFSTRITFSGSDFPQVYAGGSMERVYQLAFEGATEAEIREAGLNMIDRIAFRALGRYEPRAHAFGGEPMPLYEIEKQWRASQPVPGQDALRERAQK